MRHVTATPRVADTSKRSTSLQDALLRGPAFNMHSWGNAPRDSSPQECRIFNTPWTDSIGSMRHVTATPRVTETSKRSTSLQDTLLGGAAFNMHSWEDAPRDSSSHECRMFNTPWTDSIGSMRHATTIQRVTETSKRSTSIQDALLGGAAFNMHSWEDVPRDSSSQECRMFNTPWTYIIGRMRHATATPGLAEPSKRSTSMQDALLG